MKSKTTTILILGAGTGGIVTAKALKKKIGQLSKSHPVRIILFEKEEKNVFAPSLLWLMVGKRKPADIYRYTSCLQENKIEVVIGEIQSINAEQTSVKVSNQTYSGDYMVIALGAQQTESHDLQRYGYDFYTLAGADNFHQELQGFKGGKIAIVVPSLPYKCPAAPYEASLLVRDFIRKKGLLKKTEISLFTPEPGPLPVAGKMLSDNVRMLLQSKGINYHPEHELESASETALRFSNGLAYDFNLLAYTPRQQAPLVIKDSGLAGISGWIEVDRNTLQTGYPNIYAIGDNTFIPLETGTPLPKAGVFAHAQADVVASRIANQIHGSAQTDKFNGFGQCFLETGGGKAGYASGNFYASPAPQVNMKMPGFFWHFAKVWFEKYWFYKYF